MSRPQTHPQEPDDLAVQDAYFAGLKPADGSNADAVQPMQFISFQEAAKLESGDYTIKRLFPAQGVVLLFGEPACFKSFTVLSAAAHISEGWRFGGRRVRKRPVYYLALEGSGGLARRIQAFKAWARKTGKPEMKGTFLFWTHGFRLNKWADCQRLCDSILAAGHKGATVVVDTLSQSCLGIDENSSQMAEAVGNAAKIADAIGGLLVAVHHVGKDSTKGPRGHSSLMGNVDGAIFAHKSKGKMRATWTVHKAKDDAEGQTLSFKLHVFELGLDADGEKVTSCAAEAFEPEQKTEVKPAYGGLMKPDSNAAKAFEAFREAVAENGSGRSATLEEWREVYYRNSSAEPNSKRSQFSTDRKTLTDKLCILRVENDVYTVNDIVVQGFDEWP
ncbi:MAG: helicase RepA family protein [Desulfovibrio sp.]|nr:helicase RepA family protein [Desulfovibrio sp.]